MNKPPLILMVDDEENFREIFESVLTGAGYQVKTATNGKESVEAAKALKPDLILMDVKMPVMDGAQAAMALRDDQETKGMKVIFLTSFGDPNAAMQEFDRKFAQEFGAVDYIKKTDDFAAITKKVGDFFAAQK